jgi:hypothetical protein
VSKADDDNRSNQLNPNNPAYYSSRGTSQSGEDDDESQGAWTGLPSYGTGVSYRAQPREQEFRLTEITLGGESRHFRVAVRGNLTREKAAELASQVVHKRHAFSARHQGFAYIEVRAENNELICASPMPVLRLHRHRGKVTHAAVRRLLRTQSYRAQADEALKSYERLVLQAHTFCHQLPVVPPPVTKASTWRNLREDLSRRFSNSPSVTPLDFSVARQALQGCGMPCEGLPSEVDAALFKRVGEILTRASIHRSPPPDPNVTDCTGRPADRYRDYFLESPLKAQLEFAAAWFDVCQPAVAAHLTNVEEGREISYSPLPCIEHSQQYW